MDRIRVVESSVAITLGSENCTSKTVCPWESFGVHARYPSARKRPARTQIATIQIRSTKECQNRRKSNLCSPSAYCPVRGAAGFSEFWGTVVPIRDWAGSITAKYRLEPYTKNCARKAKAPKFLLKRYFRQR